MITESRWHQDSWKQSKDFLTWYTSWTIFAWFSSTTWCSQSDWCQLHNRYIQSALHTHA